LHGVAPAAVVVELVAHLRESCGRSPATRAAGIQ
jgi:hypothetical protein